jgi:hypothetical protein
MSFAQPMTTLAMPLASSRRATSASVWWQTGQLATRIAASAPSAAQRATISGASTSSVVRWLRFVGAP